MPGLLLVKNRCCKKRNVYLRFVLRCILDNCLIPIDSSVS